MLDSRYLMCEVEGKSGLLEEPALEGIFLIRPGRCSGVLLGGFHRFGGDGQGHVVPGSTYIFYFRLAIDYCSRSFNPFDNTQGRFARDDIFGLGI